MLRPLLVTGLSIAIAGAGFANGRALAAGNAAPASVGVVASPTVVVEGDTVTLSVQLDSPATEQVGVQVDWGDFSAPSFLFMSPGQTTIDPPFGHLYVDDVPSGSPEDLMTITVRVDGATTALSASASVLVKNAPPTFTSFTVSPTTITPGHGVTASGVFQDLGKADRHTVSVNWGDGTSTTFLASRRQRPTSSRTTNPRRTRPAAFSPSPRGSLTTTPAGPKRQLRSLWSRRTWLRATSRSR